MEEEQRRRSLLSKGHLSPVMISSLMDSKHCWGVKFLNSKGCRLKKYFVPSQRTSRTKLVSSRNVKSSDLC